MPDEYHNSVPVGNTFKSIGELAKKLAEEAAKKYAGESK